MLFTLLFWMLFTGISCKLINIIKHIIIINNLQTITCRPRTFAKTKHVPPSNLALETWPTPGHLPGKKEWKNWDSTTWHEWFIGTEQEDNLEISKISSALGSLQSSTRWIQWIQSVQRQRRGQGSEEKLQIDDVQNQAELPLIDSILAKGSKGPSSSHQAGQAGRHVQTAEPPRADPLFPGGYPKLWPEKIQL